MLANVRDWWMGRTCALCNVYLVYSWPQHAETERHIRYYGHSNKGIINRVGAAYPNDEGGWNVERWAMSGPLGTMGKKPESWSVEDLHILSLAR